MAEELSVEGRAVWRIRAGDGVTQADFVPAFGGIASSLIVPGAAGEPRELFYRHDFFWDPAAERTRGGCPLLFPACGRTERQGEPEAYLLDGRILRMPIHGFAPRMAWTVRGAEEPDALTLALRDTPATRERFPFAFELEVTHRVVPGGLCSRHTLRNPGPRPLPYGLGYHPFFLTPPPGRGKEGVRVEIPALRRLAYNGRLTDLAGEAPPRPMPAPATDPRIHESLHEIAPGKPCWLVFPDGFQVRVEAAGDGVPGLYRFVQLYSPPDRPFLCIEPWTAHPNALNTADGPRWIAPGGSEGGRFEVRAGRADPGTIPL